MINFITKCLIKDFEARPTAATLLTVRATSTCSPLISAAASLAQVVLGARRQGCAAGAHQQVSCGADRGLGLPVPPHDLIRGSG